MSVPVVADADVLFGATTRGLLVYLDGECLIHLHWSPLILDEMCRALVDAGRKRSMAEAGILANRLRDALPHAMVETREVHKQYCFVEPAVVSAKDVHVAACAYHLVASQAHPVPCATVLLTRNLRDFRKRALGGLGIDVHHPDAFLRDLFVREPSGFSAAWRRFRLDLKSLPSAEVLLAALERDGQIGVASALHVAHQLGSVRP